MIYKVETDGSYVTQSSSAKVAIAMAYCEVGRRSEVLDGKNFKEKLREIKPQLKEVDSTYEVRRNITNKIDENLSQVSTVECVEMSSGKTELLERYDIDFTGPVAVEISQEQQNQQEQVA